MTRRSRSGQSVAAPARTGVLKDERWSRLVACAILAIVGWMVYRSSLSGVFLFDDWPTIVENDQVKHLWPPRWLVSSENGGLTTDGRPLVALSIAINWAFGGAAPLGYHVCNVALHLAVALALFGLVRVTLQGRAMAERWSTVAIPCAFSIALLWLVHPLTTAAVTYVVQRAEALAALFYVLTLYAFARALVDPGRPRWLWWSVGACLLGMATKETVATAPLAVLLYDRTFGAGTFAAALRLRWRWYAAYAATWLLLGALVFSTGFRGNSAGFAAADSPGVWAYFSTQLWGLVRYLQLTFWPFGFTFDYGMETVPFAQVLPQGLLLLGLFAATLVALWRRPAVGFLFALWFLLLAPSSSFVPVITQTLAEHRAYLSTAVLSTLVALGLFRLLGRHGAGLCAAAVVVAAFLGTQTIRRNQQYHDAIGLWADTIAQRPTNARAYFSLAVEYQRAGRLAEALPHFRRALELRPDSAAGHHGYGMALIAAGDREAAVIELAKAHDLEPQRLETIVNLGQTLLALRRPDTAMRWLEMAAARDAKSPEPRINLAAAFTMRGDFDRAREVLEGVVREFPSQVAGHYNLGIQYARARRTADAEREYRAAIALAPGFVDAYQNLGNLLMRERRPAEAVECFRAAVAAAPNAPVLHCSLAVALAESGRTSEGVAALRAFLAAHPDDARANEILKELQSAP